MTELEAELVLSAVGLGVLWAREGFGLSLVGKTNRPIWLSKHSLLPKVSQPLG